MNARFKLVLIICAIAATLYAHKQTNENQFPITNNRQKTIIWDCGNVLFYQDKLAMIYYEIGFVPFIRHIFFDHKNPNNIQKAVFEVLQTIKVNNSHNLAVYSPDGLLLPPIMISWLVGNIENKEILALAEEAIDQLYQEHKLSNNEQQLMKKIVGIMFNEDLLARYTKPIPAAINLLAECEHCNCRQIIASNWDRYSFNKLYHSSNGRTVFNYFAPEDIFISAHVGAIKPQKEFFQRILKMAHLNPADCFFIDDQQENVKAARECGICSYWFNDADYAQLRQTLINQGFLMKGYMNHEKNNS